MTAGVGAWPRGRVLGWSIAAAVLAVFVGANIHLVTVSFASQPDCVPHTRLSTEGAGALSAATSSC